ncbi:MAG: MBOAT family protein [Lachnospiraceae bacterium]|nr:MBOAT family protein [Lachnospiraceae bacterium]
MLFNSIPFLIFFPLAVLLYFLIPQRFRAVFLLAVNLLFYASQDGSVMLCLCFSILCTWTTGAIIYRSSPEKSKFLLFFFVFLNLLPLIVLKYANFTLQLFHSEKTLQLLLPAGISFYTLQALTYVAGCYRKEIVPEKNLLRYAVFVSFFPCILSGPIERAERILPQVEGSSHGFDAIRVKEGLLMMLWGYFIKLVIVSRLSILTDLVYEKYEELPAGAIAIGVFFYAFQIYGDFAGYSSIAIGAARILGYEVKANFRQPYLSRSVAEFWRRWHISLSSWFRDYMYIPLGGSRCGRGRHFLNLMIIFTVSGLWHGADLTFLLWGFLYGCYQIIGILLRPARERLERIFAAGDPGKAGKHWIYNGSRVLITFVIVSLTWIPFRSTSLSQAYGVFTGLFRGNPLSALADGTVFSLGLGSRNLLFAVLAMLLLIFVDLLCEKKKCDITGLLVRTNGFLRWSFYYILLIAIIFSANLSTQEFLYQSF